MKKWTLTLAALLLSLSLTACESSGDNASQSSDQEKQASQTESDTNTENQDESQKQMQEQIQKGLLDEGKTVAIINGTTIKGKDYNITYQSLAAQLYASLLQQGQSTTGDQVSEQVKQQTLNTIVGQTLILQDAKAKGYKATADQIKSQYDKMVDQYGSEDKFKAALKKENLTLDEMKENISQQLVFDKYVDKEVGSEAVSDKEIQQFYDQYSKTQKDAPELKDIKSQIKEQLEQQKQNEDLSKIVDKLKKSGKVDIKI
ncbi:FKBP-type peptidyl-prolyl cis-trans isomerase (trigger factor) [Pullulanibacillus pueri]|uniref:Peptidylprolyl isomerase n=1 Tax=Pullulanibacillus pueri TaxID=1437324 RepID=A0A8J3EM18_9BACL|nr:SurA N-terminal domain-containing protein [Pullulanibacillus pueri]MBM7680934.1 FKBP-type peptidyl-prolyl cis-trans isomerase (trigger factor) [Pullulanibacillus pueri]GGH81394.1 hypothetical protein GCM10007096_19230 [Pullulanibacillus pueri]